jgi:hypothetical protein
VAGLALDNGRMSEIVRGCRTWGGKPPSKRSLDWAKLRLAPNPPRSGFAAKRCSDSNILVHACGGAAPRGVWGQAELGPVQAPLGRGLAPQDFETPNVSSDP